MPAAGRLDRRVVIERNMGTTRDEMGQEVENWQPWRTIWAGKKDIKADERFRSNQELASETTVWTIHWVEGLTAQDRLVVEGKIYDITGIAELGRRSGLEITAAARLE